MSSSKPSTKRFLLEDTALILIDHQVGHHRWAASTSLPALQRNVLILAHFAANTRMPVVLTSSQEGIEMRGPLMPQLRDVLPEAYARRVQRSGTVNAWDEPAFAQACRATGKTRFVMSGVTTDIYVVGPAVSAVEEGFDVQVVTDACGSSTRIAEEMSYRRMELAGVRLTSTYAIVAELVRDWSTRAGLVAFQLLSAD